MSSPVLEPTPSQTVGPFFGYALPIPGGADLAPARHPDAVTVHGYVYDGEGEPIPDAILDFWQAAPDGSRSGEPGTLRVDASSGELLGRDGVRFTGFGRVATTGDGHWALHTLPPAADAPYIAVGVFARGLLHHLYTRIYLSDVNDALLSGLSPERRGTLIAERDGAAYRFDIRIQGDESEETVFLAFA
ncbi:MAG TPA: protocatechuate 3,4-dioxygenase subunit alpha [Actinospica sp.]|nr:protocatechuate 3,4-dioxygenase subunit alpha [Actinospica sp.]